MTVLHNPVTDINDKQLMCLPIVIPPDEAQFSSPETNIDKLKETGNGEKSGWLFCEKMEKVW